MSKSSDNVIVIRVEVEIPREGPGIFGKAKPSGRRTERSNVKITEPPEPVGSDPPQVLVRVDGPNANQRFICAKGKAKLNGEFAKYVVGRVYTGLKDEEDVEVVPPPCDPMVRCFEPKDSENWEFSHVYNNELPGADCDNGGGAENTLAIWAFFPDAGVYEVELRPFLGLCSDHTNCQGSGSGSSRSSSPGHQIKQIPETLHGTITAKKGDFQALPDKGKLVKVKGKPQWTWQGGPKGPKFDLVAGTDHGKLDFRLRGRAFRPTLVRPCGKLSLRPLYLAFDVTGRGAAAGNRGSFTIVISE